MAEVPSNGRQVPDEFEMRTVIQVPGVCDKNVPENGSLEALEGTVYENATRRFSSL